jgi:putative hydrolase of the HAD superfamily
MINTVLFDLGNVILPFDVMRLAQGLTKHSHLDAKTIVGHLWNPHIADNFETGKMSPAAYFEHITAACEFKNLSFQEFVPVFNEIFDEETGVVEMLGRMKGRYNLGLISNTNAIHVEHMLGRYDFLSQFDQRWWSNEAGVRKPNPEIFHMALAHFGVQPSESVFIDDLQENVEGAKRLGIHAIQFKDVDTLKKSLQDLGVVH